MSEFTVVKLSDGLEVHIDLEILKTKLHRRKDVKRFLSIKPGSDEYEEFIADITGLAFQTLVELSNDDFGLIDKAFARAIKSVMGVNPN